MQHTANLPAHLTGTDLSFLVETACNQGLSGILLTPLGEVWISRGRFVRGPVSALMAAVVGQEAMPFSWRRVAGEPRGEFELGLVEAYMGMAA